MKFPTIKEMAKEIAERAMNEYEYEGKTILQWVETLKDYDDKKSTLERIVQKLEEEKSDWNYDYNVPIDRAIDVVKEEGGIE